jgi:23S rRNA (adenine2503-C2)-methyltransferase
MEILGCSSDELSSLCKELGYPAYRGIQITEWVYKKNVRNFAAMSNLPTLLREELAKTASLTRSEVVDEAASPDGTRKFLLRLSDGETIETVFIPYPDRVSVCVSTQIGCSAGCVFCATAKGGLIRNLAPGEIVDQVLSLQEIGKQRVTHVVFMGMGEPLLNFDNTIKAARILNDEVGIGMRRITISTVGITPKIRELQALKLQLTLGISLHATDDALRHKLMPITSKYPLDELIRACREYADFTKRRITFEYLLLNGINDSVENANKLAILLKGMLANVNLIPYNETQSTTFSRPIHANIRSFKAALEAAGIEVTQRFERGHSISAACGQLRRRNG